MPSSLGPVLARPAPRRAEARELDAGQARVVAHRGSPMLVLAGPGTGKTTTLVEHVASRVAAGSPLERILVLTFSRRAAVDLRRSIAERVGHSATAPAAMTIHSFCHAAVRRFADADAGADSAAPLLRLLTAPEQEFRLREVLSGSEADRWPATLEAALPTRGFTAELRQVLVRARQLGMDPEDLTELGREVDRPEWAAAGEFFEEYLELLDFENALDYGELVHRTRLLLASPEQGPQLRAQHDAVVVDEFQDLDPAQVALVRLLVGRGGELVAFADPDESIYRFRGADPRLLGRFAEMFAGPRGAKVVVLPRAHRHGRAIAESLGRIASRLPVPAGLAEHVGALRGAEAVGPEGTVEAFTCESPGAEAQHIAHLLRQAHLVDGVPWDRMAVLVRRGRRMIPALSRALVAAGVPVEVAGDEIPLSAELAVRPLLQAIDVVAQGGRPDPEQAVRLLVSPLGGLDSMGIRRLGRALRQREREELAGAALPQRSGELIAAALADLELLDAIAEGPAADEVVAARALGTLLADVTARAQGGAGPHELLWTLWQATPWPTRLQAAAARGGESGHQADRDLDAVCALFDVAARKETTGNRGLADLVAEVAAQQIPADTNREADTRRKAVRLLTAHRAKGLEWDVVVVAGVQEGTWPDLRRHDGLLEAQRLEPGTIAEPEPASVALAEERRLFLVACSRARRRLVVTAVEGTEGEGDQPSRFLTDLGVGVRAVTGRPRRPMTLSGLVAELRRVAVDPESTPALRDVAAERLAVLASATDDEGRALAPQADPARWWGLREVTTADEPLVAPGEPVVLTGSALASLLTCPRQWYLERQVHAEQASSGASSLGSVVHALAQHATEQDWDVADMVEQLDGVWEQLPFDAAWLSASERAAAEAALERYVAWEQNNPRRLLGAEVKFDVEVDVGTDRVRLKGSVDRLEQDSQGRLVIVDLKTGKRVPTVAQVEGMEQLGLYQLAAELGAFDDVAGAGRRAGGAEVVYLREQQGSSPWPKVMAQPSIVESPHLDAEAETGPTWVHDRLARAAAIVRAGEFPATRCEGCKRCPFATSCPAVAAGRQVL